MRSGNLVEGDEAETKALITVCLVKIVKSRRFGSYFVLRNFRSAVEHALPPLSRRIA
jgi:hypothetical protein